MRKMFELLSQKSISVKIRIFYSKKGKFMNEEKIKEERLEGFEKALKDILNEYEKLGKELEILRNDGKMKTTKFRELLGKKLVYSMIITIFKRYNLINDEEK